MNRTLFSRVVGAVSSSASLTRSCLHNPQVQKGRRCFSGFSYFPSSTLYHIRRSLASASVPFKLNISGSRAASSKPEKVLADLIVTPRCAKRIVYLNSKVKGEELQRRLRVSVEGGGCSGFQYTFALENISKKLEEGDQVYESNGAVVVTDETSLEFMRGATVDFAEDLLRSSFAVINNPNSESGCGCGTSFSLKMDDV